MPSILRLCIPISPYYTSPAPWCGIAIQVRIYKYRDCSTSRIRDCSTSRIRDCSASGIRDCSRNSVCFVLMFSSPFSLRTEISAQLRRGITCTDVARLVCFDKNRGTSRNDRQQNNLWLRNSPKLHTRDCTHEIAHIHQKSSTFT